MQYRLRRRRLPEIFDFAALVLRTHLASFAPIVIPPLLRFVARNTALILWWGRYGPRELEWVSWEHAALLGLICIQRSMIGLPVLLMNGNLLFEARPGRREILRTAVGFAPRYLWSQAVLWPFQVFVMAWTFVLPWRALVTQFSRSEVIVLERLRGQDLSRRMNAIVSGQTERGIACLLLDLALMALILLSCGFAFNILLDMMSLSERYWWLPAQFSLFSPVMHFLILSYCVYHTTAKFLYYIDSRALREGWDVELMLVKGVRETEDST